MTTLAAIGRNEIHDYVDALFTVYIVLIFIRILLTWVPRMPYNRYLRAAVAFVERTTDPYLAIFRAILRPVGFGGMALDLSPIIAIIVLYVGLDAVIFPIFRPSSRWLSGQTFIHAAQRRVGRLPAYVILVVLALPFAIAEPAKLLALYLMATGRGFIGLLVLVGAYLLWSGFSVAAERSF